MIGGIALGALLLSLCSTESVADCGALYVLAPRACTWSKAYAGEASRVDIKPRRFTAWVGA